MKEKNTTSVEEGKGLAIVAYITIIGLIVALILNQEKKNPFTAFHVRQSLGIGLLGIAISVVNVIPLDRKSTRLNSSHVSISYAVFCLKQKTCKRYTSTR